jgi:hypothetical protein
MPTKTKEYPLMMAGDLVETVHDIHTVPMGDPIYPGGNSDRGLPQGTAGIIICRPSASRPRQFLVHFVGGMEWWMYHNEIQPLLREGEKNTRKD